MARSRHRRQKLTNLGAGEALIRSRAERIDSLADDILRSSKLSDDAECLAIKIKEKAISIIELIEADNEESLT